MDLHDFPRCLRKSGCRSHPPPRVLCRPMTHPKKSSPRSPRPGLVQHPLRLPVDVEALAKLLGPLRWAFDISIIIADLIFFSAFYVVLTVFQCVLGHSTRST